MNARAKKLALFYEINGDEAKSLIAAGLDTPRKVKAGIDKAKLPKKLKDKMKKRK